MPSEGKIRAKYGDGNTIIYPKPISVKKLPPVGRSASNVPSIIPL